MNDPFRNIQDYELVLYTLTEQHSAVARSTLVLIHVGVSMAKINGEVYFHNGIRLVVRERLIF